MLPCFCCHGNMFIIVIGLEQLLLFTCSVLTTIYSLYGDKQMYMHNNYILVYARESQRVKTTQTTQLVTSLCLLDVNVPMPFTICPGQAHWWQGDAAHLARHKRLKECTHDKD